MAGQEAWDTLVDSLMSVADLFGIGDLLRGGWAEATAFFSSIDLFESGAAILNTLKDGIMSKWQDLKDSVTGAFSQIRDLLPFSDAKEGPLSQLTLNGAKIMTTLAEGVSAGAGSLQNQISETLQGASAKVSGWWDSLFSDQSQNLLPDVPAVSSVSENNALQKKGNLKNAESSGNSYTINISKIELPSVKDGQSFLASLESLIAEYGGDIAPA